MKYRILSFCMALLLIIPMTINQFAEAADNTESFKDSADIKKVRLLEALGLMEIDSETGFFWDEMPVKRSDLAKIICKMFDISETADASPHFADVKEADRAYVETAVRNGYMSGYSDEKFGADDYVTKPFRPLELLARVNSQLRRYSRFLNMVKEPEVKDNIYVVGGLELNFDTKEVTVDEKPVKLTPIEFKILALLIKNPGRVFAADEIYERVWNEQAINTDTIMVHIRKIREKIEINPKNPKYLKVVWGVGYKIEKQ